MKFLDTSRIFLSFIHRDIIRHKRYFFDNIVNSFTEEDVKQLGDNIVLILETVKEMTQPEIMHMLQNTANVIREEDENENVSLLGIIRQLNDPAVKRGLSKTLTVLKTVSDK